MTSNFPILQGPYKLKIKFLSATLERDTDAFGKMDPCVSFEFTRGGTAQAKKFQGPVHKGGHKTPVWNWDFELYYGGESAVPKGDDKFKISVLEEDQLTFDLVAASKDLTAAELFSGDKAGQKTIDLYHENKVKGKIVVES